MQHRIEHNLAKLYLIKIAKWFMLVMPVMVLFYTDNGLSLYEIFILQGVYSVTVVLLEIPSGYYADVLGRKKTLIIGTIVGCLGYIVYSFSYGFWGFLLAELVLGFGESFVSGADSALLYDSLKAQNRKHEYMKLEGRIISIGNFAEAFAGILGGLLAGLSFRAPFIAQAFIAFIGIPAAFSLVEPKRKTSLTMSWHEVLRIVKFALIDYSLLRRNIIFSSIIGCATLTMAWMVQPYFQLVNIPTGWYGVLWTLLNLTVGVFSLFASRIENRLGERTSVICIALLIAAGYGLLSAFTAQWGIVIIFFFYMVRGFATPVLKGYINKITDSSIRATVLSVRNFVIRILFAIVGPFLGWMADVYTLSQALWFASILFFVLGSISMWMFIWALKLPVQTFNNESQQNTSNPS